jgi:hypothetical protein
MPCPGWYEAADEPVKEVVIWWCSADAQYGTCLQLLPLPILQPKQLLIQK